MTRGGRRCPTFPTRGRLVNVNICNFSSVKNQEIRCDFLKYETNEAELLEMAMSLSEETSRVRKEEEREEEGLAKILALSLEEK